MEYELDKRLIEIAETEEKINRRFNLSKFLSLRPQIDKAIKDGWSIKFIWETLRKDKKIHIGYRMFLRMVKQYAIDPSATDNETANNKNGDSEKESNSLSELQQESKVETESDDTQDRIKAPEVAPFDWTT